jgi:hypothetical protein
MICIDDKASENCLYISRATLHSHTVQASSGNSGVQDQMDEACELCTEGGAGIAFIHYSTVAKCYHTHTPCVDKCLCLAGHPQVAYQGTDTVNVRNADVATYGLSTSTSTSTKYRSLAKY